MASFELRSSSCDGHIKALHRAIQVASRICKEGLIEFTPEKVRLCTKTELFLVKFIFTRDFFNDYICDRKHRCYVNLKALLQPFKSNILVGDRDNFRNQVTMRCIVEDQVNNQLVFKIGCLPSAMLTYKININDIDPEQMRTLNAINRTIDYKQIRIAPAQQKKERFLLSAFNSFAPDIDQVTIKTSPSEVKFIGSISQHGTSHGKRPTTSEFTHKRDEFSIFEVKEDLSITLPLRTLKVFLSFVESHKNPTNPEYTFEGMGLPAHFDYKASLFRAHFVSATPFTSFLEMDNPPLPITMGPNESFLADENVIQADDDNGIDATSYDQYIEEEDLDEEDGYNDNQSETSELIDGNLEAFTGSNGNGNHENSDATSFLNTSRFQKSAHYTNSHTNGGSVFGAESIRSEIRDINYDPEKVKELLNLDQDPDEIENAVIQYSDSSDSE